MSTLVAWAIVLFAGGALVLVLACTSPAGASTSAEGEASAGGGHGTGLTNTSFADRGVSQSAAPSLPSAEVEEVTAFCAEDATQDHMVDVSDITLIGSQFGKATTETTAYLDIWPELAPDGFVDISDVVLTGSHFGKLCYGTVGTEPDPEGDFPSFVWGCVFKASGFMTQSQGNWVAVPDWGGKTICQHGGGSFTTSCSFTFERWVGNSTPHWEPVAATGTFTAGGAFCQAQGPSSALPMYTLLRGTILHWVESDGVTVHGPHYHAENATFTIP